MGRPVEFVSRRPNKILVPVELSEQYTEGSVRTVPRPYRNIRRKLSETGIYGAGRSSEHGWVE